MKVGETTMLRIAGQRFVCTCGSNVQTYAGNDVYRCNGCGSDYAGEDYVPPQPKRPKSQRIVQVVTTIVITDSSTERVETFTSSRIEENLNGGRDSDVLAASRALERVRKDLSKQMDNAGPLLEVVPDPPCLSPQKCRCIEIIPRTLQEPAAWEQADDCPVHPLEEVVVLESFPDAPPGHADHGYDWEGNVPPGHDQYGSFS